MIITPLPESEAEGKTKENYQKIKHALQTDFLPLFFQYIGPFPEYLEYVTNQLTENLQNKKFKEFVDEIGSQAKKSISESLTKSTDIQEWLHRYRYSPQFYNFETNLRTIFLINIKLALIFIALREAVKGWAIAAKQILSQYHSYSSNENNLEKDQGVIYEGFFEVNEKQLMPFQYKGSFQSQATQSVEKRLLQEYLKLCHVHFYSETKKENYLMVRLGLEQLFLRSLPLLPQIIYSPINIVLKLTEKYSNYPELLYLLSEHFPVLAVQKVIFSGFLL